MFWWNECILYVKYTEGSQNFKIPGSLQILIARKLALALIKNTINVNPKLFQYTNINEYQGKSFIYTLTSFTFTTLCLLRKNMGWYAQLGIDLNIRKAFWNGKLILCQEVALWEAKIKQFPR